jgi:hypothetical protein
MKGADHRPPARRRRRRRCRLVQGRPVGGQNGDAQAGGGGPQGGQEVEEGGLEGEGEERSAGG